MQRTKFFALVRAVEKTCQAYGYLGNALDDNATARAVGSYRQQLDMVSIYQDIRPRPATAGQRLLAKRLIQAAVLTSAVVAPRPKLQNFGSRTSPIGDKLARARRRA